MDKKEIKEMNELESFAFLAPRILIHPGQKEKAFKAIYKIFSMLMDLGYSREEILKQVHLEYKKERKIRRKR